MSQDDVGVAEVDRLVDEAKQAGAILRTGEAAQRLLREHPGLRITIREAALLIARRAVAAGVPIQFTSVE